MACQVELVATTASARVLWAGVLGLCTECIERVGLASRRFAAVRRVVEQLRWLSTRVQQPEAAGEMEDRPEEPLIEESKT